MKSFFVIQNEIFYPKKGKFCTNIENPEISIGVTFYAFITSII